MATVLRSRRSWRNSLSAIAHMGASSFVNVPNSTRRHGPPVFLRLSRQGPSGSVRVRVPRRVRAVCGILAVAHVARRSHGGGALDRCHPRRLPVSVALVGLALLAVLALAAAAVPVSARTGERQGVRAKAKARAAAARARTASKARPTSATLTGRRLGWQRSSAPPPWLRRATWATARIPVSYTHLRAH